MKKRILSLAAIVMVAIMLCGNAAAVATQTRQEHLNITLNSGTKVGVNASTYYYVGDMETTLPFYRDLEATEPDNVEKHYISVVVVPEGKPFSNITVTSEHTGGELYGKMYNLEYKDGSFRSYNVASMGELSSDGKSLSYNCNGFYGAFYTYAEYYPDPKSEEFAYVKCDFLVLSQKDVDTYLSTGKIYGYTWPGLKDLLVGASATPTASKVTINGTQTNFAAYNINGNNYFKLRDIAKVISGSGKQFDVTWDAEKNAINLISGKAYTVIGGELTANTLTGTQAATRTISDIYLDGNHIGLTAYNINGNNYFKLRDLGATFNFGVTWDGAANTIAIDTSTGYTPDK